MRPTAPPRAAYRLFRPLTPRWADNDAYGHINNVVYYSFFDTMVNANLVELGLLDIEHGPRICLVVASGCDYFAPLAFPQPIEGGLRIDRLGGSSLTYGIGIFAAGAATAAAAGRLTHVMVDRQSRRPLPLPQLWLDALAPLVVPG